jgi:hypothetical protein
MHRNPNHFPKYIKEEGCDKMEGKENAVFLSISVHDLLQQLCTARRYKNQQQYKT